MTTQTSNASETNESQVFWRFWLAMTVSGAGSAMTVVALPLAAVTVLDATVLETTLLAATGQVAWLVLGLPAGVIVQRYPLRGLQVTLDLVRLAAIGSIPVAWWAGHLTFPHLLVVALVTGMATVLFDIGNSTFLPAIIDKRELNARNSLMSGTHAVIQTGGPSVSGLLVQLAGPVGVLAIDAVSYLASAVTLRTLPERRPQAQPHAKATQLIRQGWNYVIRHPVMRPCMVWATIMNFVTAALLALTPLYLVREVGVSASIVGAVIAMDGVGALIGSAFATRLSRRVGTARAIIVAGVIGGLVVLMTPFTTTLSNIYFYALGLAGLSFSAVVGSIMTRTHRQTDSPPALLSRVMGTVRFVSWGALPLGAALSGLLASAVGIRAALWIMCLAAFAAPLSLLLTSVRHRRDLSDAHQE
ncbi:MFS transporter [Streptomyces caelestis]|jgi:MFS family permease|uniref:MFS family permease n=1 Tax=Streptomyces caelestis TaxID=36816 RepID=A0A7W9GZI4_9ACTN|nr:MFS transporter [Streptomyces caelestis]MBB5792935.1 MFS family permease [Streptomyces caelestis]GGW75520.1 MFS transporter [Streptomyces caelestis]